MCLVGIMGSTEVVWLLPWMVLEYGIIYAVILSVGAIQGFAKWKSTSGLLRDILLILLVLLGSLFGLRTTHSVAGLVLVGIGACTSMCLHGSQFGKTNDMAPFGYLTSFSIVMSLLVLSGILTSEL